MDLDELEDYRAYVLASGEPKKFRWATADHAGTRPPEGAGLPAILEQASKMSGGKLRTSDIYEYARATGKKQVTLADKWEQQPDGTYRIVGQVYVDKEGNEVDIEGFVYVPSQHKEALAVADRVFGAESLN